MVQVAIGYGEYSGYLITEIPDEFLSSLGQRYPLSAGAYDTSDGATLLIAVAVHEELARRASGGKAKKHIPTVSEFAVKIVTQGFWQLSKVHHPDQHGDNEAQRRLAEARDCLKRLCDNLTEDPVENAVWIPEPLGRQTRTPHAVFADGPLEDDVPF